MEQLKKHKKRTTFAVIVIVLLFLIGFTGGGRKGFAFVERVLGDIFSPVISLGTKGVQGVIGGVETIISLPSLEKENREMKKEVAQLSEENRKLNDIIARTDYLRSESKLLSTSEFSMVKAQVIGKEPGNYFFKLMINKGLNDGLKEGDTVVVGIDAQNGVVLEGLVGKIVEVGDTWSNVDSIINEGNSVSFRSIRTQDGGILSGDSTGNLKGYSYDSYADVVINDRLITSGIGDLYKGGLFIGTVSGVQRNEEQMIQTVEVTPAVDFKKDIPSICNKGLGVRMEYLWTFLAIYGAFILQNIIFSYIHIQGATLNGMLLFLAFYVLRKKPLIKGRYVGLIFGAFCDIFYGERVGFFMLIYFVVGFITEKLSTYFNSDSFITVGLISGITTLLYQIFVGVGYNLLGYEFSMKYIFYQSFHSVILIQALVAGIIYLFLPYLKRFKVRRKSNETD